MNFESESTVNKKGGEQSNHSPLLIDSCVLWPQPSARSQPSTWCFESDPEEEKKDHHKRQCWVGSHFFPTRLSNLVPEALLVAMQTHSQTLQRLLYFPETAEWNYIVSWYTLMTRLPQICVVFRSMHFAGTTPRPRDWNPTGSLLGIRIWFFFTMKVVSCSY